MNEQLEEILTKQPILLFDGECGFCNRSIQFLMAREKNKKLHFASLQSDIGMMLRNYFEIDSNTDSIILIKDHGAYIKSCAVLRLTLYMKGLWPTMMVFTLVPPFIRNAVYDFIARRRMRLFGRIEQCALLKKEDSARFLAY